LNGASACEVIAVSPAKIATAQPNRRLFTRRDYQSVVSLSRQEPQL
jgi:hypothetical protein